jgi:hypothetical protein
VESNWVHSALRPLIGLLCQPRVIMMMEKLCGMIGRGNRSTRRKPAPMPLCPPQTPTCCSDANPGRRGGKPAIIFFFNLCGGTLGTAATTDLLYQPRMIGDCDCGEIGGIKIGRGNRSTRRKSAPMPVSPPQTPTCCSDANPGRRGGKPAINRLSYGTASPVSYNPEPFLMKIF